MFVLKSMAELYLAKIVDENQGTHYLRAVSAGVPSLGRVRLVRWQQEEGLISLPNLTPRVRIQRTETGL